MALWYARPRPTANVRIVPTRSLIVGYQTVCCGLLVKMVATPTGFEPAISALTGQCVKPLHHGAAMENIKLHLEL